MGGALTDLLLLLLLLLSVEVEPKEERNFSFSKRPVRLEKLDVEVVDSA